MCVTHCANTGVNAKGTSGADVLHDGQECGRDDNVSGPNTSCQDGGTHPTKLEREQLGTLPGDVTGSRGVKGDKDDHHAQHHVGPVLRIFLPLDELASGLCGHLGKGDRGERETGAHSRLSAEQDPPLAHSVEQEHGDDGEEQVGTRDDQTSGGRVIESSHGEYGGRVVHQGVETTQLLKDTDPKGGDGGSSVRPMGEDHLPSLPDRRRVDQSGRDGDILLEGGELEVDVSGRHGAVRLVEGQTGLFPSTLEQRVSRGFGEKVNGARLQQGGDDSDRKLDTPPVLAGQGYTDTVRKELPSGDGDGLDGHQGSPESGRREFSNVYRESGQIA